MTLCNLIQNRNNSEYPLYLVKDIVEDYVVREISNYGDNVI
jgi:hypothetical protein